MTGAVSLLIAATATQDRTPPTNARGRADITGIWTNRSGTSLDSPATHNRGNPLETTAATFRVPTARDRYYQGGGLRKDRDGVTTVTPDGLAYALDGERIRQERGESDSWLDRNPWERCISRGMPAMMLPEPHAEHHVIVDAGDVVALHAEALHETRLVTIGTPLPLRARPPPSRLGTSHGEWTDERTLTITTTGFRGDRPGRDRVPPTSPIPGRRRGPGHTMTITETIRMINTDRLAYRLVMDEPRFLDEPIVYEFPMRRETRHPHVLEYACHEGNRSMPTMLRGARLNEAEAIAASRRASSRRLLNDHPGTAEPALPYRTGRRWR